MRRVAKLLRIAGYVLLYAGIALIAAGILSIWWFHGFAAVQEVMSPFNVMNFIAMMITLAPGMLLIWGADKLNAKADAKNVEK